MDITQIVKLIVELLIALATTFLIPWLKDKVEDNRRAKVLTYVNIAVQAAEQISRSEGWGGEAKKSWVIDYLNNLGIVIDIDEINAMIESAVLKLNKELK